MCFSPNIRIYNLFGPQFVVVSVSLLLSLSCETKKEGILEIDPLKLGDKTFTLSTIADDIEYVTFDNNILFSAKLVYDYYISDSVIIISASPGILMYDNRGNFVREIGSKGRGPEEYLYGTSLAVNEPVSEIYVIDINNIFVYNYSGKLIRKIPVDGLGMTDVEIISGNIFLECTTFGNHNHNWVIIDTLGNVLDEKLNTIPLGKVFVDKTFTFRLGTDLFYWNMYNDTVFSISPDMKSRAAMRFVNRELMIVKESSITNLSVGQTIDFMNVTRFFGTSRYIVLEYHYHLTGRIITLIDKENNSLYTSKSEDGIINDLDNGPPFELKKKILEIDGKEYLVSFVDAFTLKTHVAGDDFKDSDAKCPDKKKKLEKLAESLEETDNPVMMLVRLK